MWSGPVLDVQRETIVSACGEACHVLDLGCGTGLIAEALTARGVTVIGVDASAAMLRRAAARHRIARGILSDLERAPVDPGEADAVIATNVLHIHPRPTVVLEVATRAVAPGGLIVVSWPVDGLSPGRMRRIDRRLGRGLLASLVADLLRRLTMLLAAFSTAGRMRRRTTQHDLRALVAAWPHAHLDTRLVIAGCTEIAILRTTPRSTASRPLNDSDLTRPESDASCTSNVS